MESDIPRDKTFIFAGLMNGHVRRRNVVVVHKCAGEHFSYDSRNTDEPRVVEFADSLGLVNVQYTFYETGFSVVEE